MGPTIFGLGAGRGWFSAVPKDTEMATSNEKNPGSPGLFLGEFPVSWVGPKTVLGLPELKPVPSGFGRPGGWKHLARSPCETEKEVPCVAP